MHRNEPHLSSLGPSANFAETTDLFRGLNLNTSSCERFSSENSSKESIEGRARCDSAATSVQYSSRSMDAKTRFWFPRICEKKCCWLQEETRDMFEAEAKYPRHDSSSGRHRLNWVPFVGTRFSTATLWEQFLEHVIRWWQHRTYGKAEEQRYKGNSSQEYILILYFKLISVTFTGSSPWSWISRNCYQISSNSLVSIKQCCVASMDAMPRNTTFLNLLIFPPTQQMLTNTTNQYKLLTLGSFATAKCFSACCGL
jgi:hypothetical protein